ncbi:MAG: hypothetical protein QGF38_11070 [Rhodospirillales bacterium]|jgi:hypothetical protein|nr:hypothetical protein [Rhodospirillales bacterium]MDP7652231.1 hypothetical protein [Rhodospirillales bacterium]
MTRRIGDRMWTEFVAWCRARGLQPLPAHPWTLAAYARWCEPRHRYPGIVKRLRAIARAHVLHSRSPSDRDPTVTRTLRRIEARARAKNQGAALFRADDFTKDHTPPAKTPPIAKTRRVLRSAPPLVRRRPVPITRRSPGGSWRSSRDRPDW